MKNMMIFTHLGLTLSFMLSVDSMRSPCSASFPLNMAEQSVDDMYDGCDDKASMDKIKEQYSEELRGREYGQAWRKAERCAVEKFNKRSKEDMALTKDHMRAICVYTGSDVHSKFNEAVREQRNDYLKSFQYHILHFLLTTAIKILNPYHQCLTTYRRTKDTFTGEVTQNIRLGSFASSSYRTDLHSFGDVTCFKIETCHGGYLKIYPLLDDDEKEVLIPPYEMFTIEDIVEKPRTVAGLEDCKVVYVLKSAGQESNLNCEICKQNPFVYFGQNSKRFFTTLFKLGIPTKPKCG